jgi:hypothetical protein
LNANERTVLKAAAQHAQNHGGPVSCEAKQLYADLQPQGFTLQDVSVALLLLRDQGMIETEEPTVGDPRDGEWHFHVTEAGLQHADSIAGGAS